MYLAGQENELTLVFAGDIMGHDSQIESARTGDQYSYDTCFSLISPYLEKADIAIANLEVTLAGPPYKGYPQFSSPDPLATAARDAGFDLFITANNHSLDRGKKGLERTVDVLDTSRIIHTGTFKNNEERALAYPLIIEKNGIRLGILNYTYGTNGLKVEAPNIVNYIEKEEILTDLEKVRSAEPDYIIVTIHWGLEYQRIQNEQQEELAHFILENGADAIIGSHPHVVQPVKMYSYDDKEKLVVYSLGNFISNQRERYRNGGILFELKLEKTGSGTDIAAYSYLPVWVFKPTREDGGVHFVLVPSNLEKSEYEKLGMDDNDYEKMKTFNDDTQLHLQDISLIQ